MKKCVLLDLVRPCEDEGEVEVKWVCMGSPNINQVWPRCAVLCAVTREAFNQGSRHTVEGTALSLEYLVQAGLLAIRARDIKGCAMKSVADLDATWPCPSSCSDHKLIVVCSECP